MRAGSSIAQLVRAILFQLIDQATGEVIGDFGTQTAPDGTPNAPAIRFIFPDDPGPGFPDDATAGLYWYPRLGGALPGRFVWIVGPSIANPAGGNTRRPVTFMSAAEDDPPTVNRVIQMLAAGLPGAMFFPGFEDQLAYVVVANDEIPPGSGNYQSIARMNAGGTDLFMQDDGAVSLVQLRRLVGGTYEDVATSPATAALTFPAGWQAFAARVNSAAKSGRVCVVQGIAQNVSGGAIATPIANVATVPAGFRPSGPVAAAAWSSLTASRCGLSTAGVVSIASPAGNIPNNGFVEFQFCYDVAI